MIRQRVQPWQATTWCAACALILAACPHDLADPFPVPPEGGPYPDRLVNPTFDGPTPPTPLPDGGGPAPDTASCTCSPGTTRPCGPCDEGTETCRTDCQGYRTCQVPEGVCEPDATRSCGNCGTQSCGLACSWRPCAGEKTCKRGVTEACPNNCGERTCGDNCEWGECSKKDGYSGASSKQCVSDNHCGDWVPKCVACWLKCNADGSTYEDAWCAGSQCQSCSPIDDQC